MMEELSMASIFLENEVCFKKKKKKKDEEWMDHNDPL